MSYLTEEEQEYMKQEEERIRLTQQQQEQGQVMQDAQAFQLREEEKSVLKEQLSLGDELEVIEHLLKGEIFKTNGEGISQWIKPDDSSMEILTEHGVQLIMNTIMFYLNKNTLLSNYDEETINRKMEDFATDLADTIFMEYEKVFKQPSFKECKIVLEERLHKKVELRKFALNLIGQKSDEEKIKHDFIHEIEDKIESEITKIKEQIIKNKLKRFLILMRAIQDSVHSTYLRAYNGIERRTLRQHIHVSESIGSNPLFNQQKKKRFGLGR